MSRFLSMAGEQVAELADRSADSGRLSRGRALFRKGSVSDLSVTEGSVIASVRGSEGDEYETTIATALAPPGVIRQIVQAQDPAHRRSVEDLIGDGVDVCPRDIDLVFGCDCADWDEPCKHVVAVLLAFADRVDLDEAELLRWRGVDLSGLVTEEPEVPPRPQSPPRLGPEVQPETKPRKRPAAEPQTPSGSLSSETLSPSEPTGQAEPGDRSARLSELKSLLGDTAMRVPATDDSSPKRPESAIEPALAEFLGVGMTFNPVDVSGITVPDPLFVDVQLGPLADLGPELAKAVATIMARLEDVSSR